MSEQASEQIEAALVADCAELLKRVQRLADHAESFRSLAEGFYNELRACQVIASGGDCGIPREEHPFAVRDVQKMADLYAMVWSERYQARDDLAKERDEVGRLRDVCMGANNEKQEKTARVELLERSGSFVLVVTVPSDCMDTQIAIGEIAARTLNALLATRDALDEEDALCAMRRAAEVHSGRITQERDEARAERETAHAIYVDFSERVRELTQENATLRAKAQAE